MQLEHLRHQFLQIRQERDWAAVLDCGCRLHALGDFGTPSGDYAYWMAIAATMLGRGFEAIFYSDMGISRVEPGSALEARLLVNGSYICVTGFEPNRAMVWCQRYLSHYSLYPKDEQLFKPRVRYHMGMAQADRRNYSEAVHHYQVAAQEALSSQDVALSQMIQLDLVVALLRQGGGREEAEATFRSIDSARLTDRGQFAYAAVQTELLYHLGDFVGATGAARKALDMAAHSEEPLKQERGHLHFLLAKGAISLGDRHSSLLHGFQAAVLFKDSGFILDMADCEEFLQSVLVQTE